METVTSRNNRIYKAACKLLRRKYREEMQMYLMEGKKPLEDALKVGMDVEKVFVCEDGDHGLDKLPEDKITVLSKDLFRDLADTENSQGVVAQVRIRRLLAEDFVAFAKEGNIIILDRLQDPGNAGTTVRTAEAAGVMGVVALKGTVDIFSPKTVRAASGSLMRIPILTGIDEKEMFDLIGEGGWKLAVTTIDKGDNCFERSFTDNIALVIGNEGSGVSQSLALEADIDLMIPMEGEIESLNASVAAGILMYQIRK